LANIILCTHNSGGVGKTTLATHITGILASRIGKTLLIDCDDQADSWQFYAKKIRSKDNMFYEVSNDLIIYENKAKNKITKTRLKEYDNIILDIDSPLANTVQLIVNNHPDVIFIPVNVSQQHKALRSLDKPLSVVTALAQKASYSPKVVIVPLGIERDVVLERLQNIEEKYQNCHVAPAMKEVQAGMSLAVYEDRKYLWEYDEFSDIKDYFASLVDEYMG